MGRGRNRGNTFVDYLLVSLIVAGIGVPIVMRYFGDPIRKTLFDNRQELVDFLAQNPKRPVPNIWFAKEISANPPDANVGAPGPIGDPGDGGASPNVSGPGNIASPNVSGPGNIPPPQIGDAGQITGGEGAGRGAAGGTDGGSSGSGMDGSFFASNAGTKKDDASSTADNAATRGAGPPSIGGDASDASDERDASGSLKKDSKKDEQSSSGKSDSRSRKYQNEQLNRIAEEERAKAHAINWWMLIKILIIIAIFFLVLLIVLGSVRKK